MGHVTEVDAVVGEDRLDRVDVVPPEGLELGVGGGHQGSERQRMCLNGTLRDVGDVLVYHNPHLQAPPDRAALERIVDVITDPPSALVRHDDRFRELGLDPDQYQDRDEVVALLLTHPELLQRPLIIRGDRGVIARPSERVMELLAPESGPS